MGMFDSLFDAKGREWQTKAFACRLDRYEIGDSISGIPSSQWPKFQVKVIGGGLDTYVESFATIADDELIKVPAERDDSLALLDYSGGWIGAPKNTTTKEA